MTPKPPVSSATSRPPRRVRAEVMELGEHAARPPSTGGHHRPAAKPRWDGAAVIYTDPAPPAIICLHAIQHQPLVLRRNSGVPAERGERGAHLRDGRRRGGVCQRFCSCAAGNAANSKTIVCERAGIPAPSPPEAAAPRQDSERPEWPVPQSNNRSSDISRRTIPPLSGALLHSLLSLCHQGAARGSAACRH